MIPVGLNKRQPQSRALRNGDRAAQRSAAKDVRCECELMGLITQRQRAYRQKKIQARPPLHSLVQLVRVLEHGPPEVSTIGWPRASPSM